MQPFNSIRFSAIFRWVLILAVLIVPQVVQAQWHATVGGQSQHKGRQALAFLPNEIWIHEGDSITWKFDVDEIHTLTFLRTSPMVQVRPLFFLGCPGFTSSPATFDGSTCVTTPPLVKGAMFTVSFPKMGNFKLVCLVHPDMTGTVHVLDSLPLPHDQDFYDEEAADQRKDLLSDLDEDNDAEHDHESAMSDDPPSTTKHVTAGVGEVVSTGGGSQTLTVMRFLHSTKTIHAGETVEWTNLAPTGQPHTITFGKEPADVIHPSSNVTMDPDGALQATIDSVTDAVHSGFINAPPQDRTFLPQSPLTVTRFRVKFTKAGTYHYICALHDNLGMKGKIVVLP